MASLDNYDGTGLVLGTISVLAALGMWQKMDPGEGSMSRGGGARQVAAAWADGEHKRVGNVSTDGENLYSYALLIGTTDKEGNKVLRNYSASGEFNSVTTSQHVGAAKPYATRVVHPKAIGILG